MTIGDVEVARALFDVQVALKRSRREETNNMKFGGKLRWFLAVINLEKQLLLLVIVHCIISFISFNLIMTM